MRLFKRKKKNTGAENTTSDDLRICPRCSWFLDDAESKVCSWCGTDILLYRNIFKVSKQQWTQRITFFILWIFGGYSFFIHGAILNIPLIAGIGAAALFLYGLYYYLQQGKKLLQIARNYIPFLISAQKNSTPAYPFDKLRKLYSQIQHEKNKFESLKQSTTAKNPELQNNKKAGLEMCQSNLAKLLTYAHELEVLQWLNQIQRRLYAEHDDTSYEYRFQKISELEAYGASLSASDIAESQEINNAKKAGLSLLAKMRLAAARANISDLLNSVSPLSSDTAVYKEVLEKEAIRAELDSETYEYDDDLEFQTARIESFENLLNSNLHTNQYHE